MHRHLIRAKNAVGRFPTKPHLRIATRLDRRLCLNNLGLSWEGRAPQGNEFRLPRARL